MNNKNSIIVGILIILAAFGIGYASHSSKTTVSVAPGQQQQQVLGASASPDHYNTEYFHNGLYVNQLFGMSSVSASSSSTTNYTALALGNSSMGQITIGTSTPATTTVYTLTTAVSSANSMIFVQPVTTTGTLGLTCYSSTTAISLVATPIFVSTASSSLNGFKVTTAGIPATNPICLNYWVVTPTSIK